MRNASSRKDHDMDNMDLENNRDINYMERPKKQKSTD